MASPFSPLPWFLIFGLAACFAIIGAGAAGPRFLFRVYDVNNDGFLTSSEIRELLEMSGDPICDDNLEIKADGADVNGGRFLFRLYDINNDGFLTSPEIREILEMSADPICDDNLEMKINGADLNEDGAISLDEFPLFDRIKTSQEWADIVAGLDVDEESGWSLDNARAIVTNAANRARVTDIDDDHLVDVFQQADEDGNGLIEGRELLVWNRLL